MKEYYVCFPSDGIDKQYSESMKYAVRIFSDNEFMFNQYLTRTYPILQHLLDEEYSLTSLKYFVNDQKELFDIVKKEYGITLNEASELVSVKSTNNPELVLYMSYGVLLDGCGVVPDPGFMVDRFLQMLWSSVEMYNIFKDIVRWPDSIKKMWELISDKYMALLFGLGYTDIGAWENKELCDVINKTLPDSYKGNLTINDMVDDAMMWIYYNDWNIGDTDENLDLTGGDG